MPERRAVEIGAEEEVRAPRPPVPGADETVALHDPPTSGEHQGPGQVGGGLGEGARRVADRDPPPSTGGHVDVVVADREVAHHAQARPGRVEQLVVHPIGEQGEDAVAPGDPAKQLVPGRRAIFRPDVGLAALLDEAQARLRDDPRHEDPGA